MSDNDELQQIIDGCKNGSEESFSRLVDIYSGRCYGFFYRLSGDRDLSDDLLSELFVRLVEKISTYKGGSFGGWLFTTAYNIFQDYLRGKHRRGKLLEGRRDLVELEQAAGGKDDDEVMDELQKQLSKLDSEAKELILMRYYGQLSFKELSEARGEPIGTVLSKVHRGLKKLRARMETFRYGQRRY